MSCEDIFDYNMMGPNPEHAEALSNHSYEKALQQYCDLGGDFFCFTGARCGDETHGQRLTEQLREAEKSLREGRLRLHLLDPGDADVAIAAFMLPFEIHFEEFSCAFDEGDSEETGYDSTKQSCTSDETGQRDDFIDAFYEYVVTAASVAKEIGDTRGQRLFSRAIDLLDRNCTGNIRYLNDLGGMNQKEAETTFNCTLDGLMSLKTQLIIEDRRKERLGLAQPSPTPAATTPPVPVETETPNAGTNVALGNWAQGVVFNVDSATQTITFKGNKGGAGETLSVPSGSAKAWDIVVRLLASSDKEGYIELRDDERYIWRKHFDRRIRTSDGSTKSVKDDLKRIKMHIACAKGVGERGPTRIRLMRRIQSSPHK